MSFGKHVLKIIVIALIAIICTGVIALIILGVASFFGRQLSLGQAFAWLAVVSAILECIAFSFRTATEPKGSAEKRKQYAQYLEFAAVTYLAASAIGIAMTL